MRIREFGESDLLVTFFTPDRGRLKGVAKGARRSKRRFVNCLDICCLANMEYEIKRDRDLSFLHSGKLIDAHPGLRSDFDSLSKASYMIELTEILFPLGEADQEMFQLLQGSLHHLERGEGNIDLIPIFFEIKAMALGGYGINMEKCCMCGRRYTGEGRAVFKRERGGIACLKCQQETALSPGMGPDAVKAMTIMGSMPVSALMDLKYTDDMIAEIKPVLKLHREYHLGQKPRTACYIE